MQKNITACDNCGRFYGVGETWLKVTCTDNRIVIEAVSTTEQTVDTATDICCHDCLRAIMSKWLPNLSLIS